MLGHQGHSLDSETESFAGAPQQGDIAACLFAEGEVLTDHHFHHMQAFHQQLVHVAVRRQLHEVAGEGNHQEDVDTQLFGQLGATGQRYQLRGVAAREDHFHRMRVEGHQDNRHPARSARLDGTRDQLGMTTVNSVENTNGQDTPTPISGDLVLPPPTLHPASLRRRDSTGGARSAVQVMIA